MELDTGRHRSGQGRLINCGINRALTSDKGVFARMMDGLASEAAVPKTVMIDATYLKAHRTATSLRSKKGGQATKGAV